MTGLTKTLTKMKTLTTLSMLLVCTGASAHAATPAQKCESAKLKAQSKYTSCRLRADAIAVTRETVADYTRCVDKIAQSYGKAEDKAEGACPRVGDLETIRGLLDEAMECTATETGGEDGQCGGGGGRLPATGQTTNYGAGSDGATQAGCAQSYTDNGDGTITDNCTGLMWEKKDDSGGIHDVNHTYSWSGASYGVTNIMDGSIVGFIDSLNDAAGNGANGFAGHTNWRIPNSKELSSIVDFSANKPAVAASFHNSAICPNCPEEFCERAVTTAVRNGNSCTDNTAPTCSCTSPAAYWSSTTFGPEPANAYYVDRHGRLVGNGEKNTYKRVRAVRNVD